MLSEGQIAEKGDHLTLLAKEGLYASMWAHQQESEHSLKKIKHTSSNQTPKAVAR